MARSGFYPNFKGYVAVLKGDDARMVCSRVGESICQTANMDGHGTYTCDTMVHTRVHTRVTTADTKSHFQEKHARTLARIAEHYG